MKSRRKFIAAMVMATTTLWLVLDSCDVTAAEEPRATESAFRIIENFDGALALKWQPVRHDPTHVSLEKKPGRLTITTQYGQTRDSGFKPQAILGK